MVYCRVCGSKKTYVIATGYHEENGEPIHEYLCSKAPCLHGGGHLWSKINRKRKWWEIVFDGCSKEECVRCGITRDVYDGAHIG